MSIFGKLFGSFSVEKEKKQMDIRQPFRSNQKKERDESGFYPIVCPHCLEKFHIWEIEFRASSGSMTIDHQYETPGNKTTSSSVNFFGEEESESQTERTGQEKVNDDLTAFPREIDEKNVKFLRRVGKISAKDSPEPKNKILRLFDENGNATDEVVRVKLMGERGQEIGDWIYLKGRHADDPELKHKPLSIVQDKYEHNSQNRVCPHCHNEILNIMGITPSYVIGIIGNTFCGKSIYIKYLLGHLEEYGILSMNGGNRMFGRSGGSYAASDLETLRQSGIEGNALLDPTRLEYVEPKVINCRRGRHGENQFIVTIFDFPGEALQPDKEITEFLDHYSNVRMNVDGWMFLFDCANIKSVRDIVSQFHPELEEFMPNNLIDSMKEVSCEQDENEQEKKKRAVKMSPNDTLNAFIDKLHGNAPFQAPVAFVISKCDILSLIHGTIRSQYPNSMIPNPTFLEKCDYTEFDEVDLDLISSNSEQIKTLLSREGLYDPIVDNVPAHVKDEEYAWFTVSSTGTPVRVGYRADHAMPIRIEEPFAWLMYMLGVLPGKTGNQELWR